MPAGKTQPVLSGVRADVTIVGIKRRQGSQSRPSAARIRLKVSTQRDICSTASMSRTRRMNPDGHNSTPLLFPRLSSPTSTGRMWPRVRTAGRSRRSTPPAIPNLNSVLESYNEDGSVSDVESIAPDGNVRVELISRDRLLCGGSGRCNGECV